MVQILAALVFARNQTAVPAMVLAAPTVLCCCQELGTTALSTVLIVSGSRNELDGYQGCNLMVPITP